MLKKFFIFVFFTLLLVPVLHINHDKISKTENRTLAPAARFLGSNNWVNKTFGRDFDNWFTDRFFGRYYLMQLNNFIFTQGGVIRGNNKVLIDQDGWLFYANDNSLKNFANLTTFSDTELKNIAKYLADIDNWCKQHGKQFYVFIMPDKNKIYGEHITLVNKVKPDNNNRTTQLLNYLNNETKVKTIYPREALLAHKDTQLLYYKNDTHWNSLGAYIAYQDIMKKIKIPTQIQIKTQPEQRPYGDLTNMTHGVPSDNTVYDNIIPLNNATCSNETMDTHNAIHCKNLHYKDNRKMFALRDSYMNAFGPFLNNTFKTTDYVWRYDIRKSDLDFIIDNHIDIVVLELVERSTQALTGLTFPKD